MTFWSVVAKLFAPPPAKAKPADLAEFDEARRRLRESGRKVAQAVGAHVKDVDDAFGELVQGMRAKPRRKSAAAKSAKKKGTNGSC